MQTGVVVVLVVVDVVGEAVVVEVVVEVVVLVVEVLVVEVVVVVVVGTTQAPPWHVPAVPPDAVHGVASATTEATQAPSGQATSWQAAGGGQSPTAWHAQRRRPVASCGPHALEQQLACSRQTDPYGRQAAASVPRRPRAPRAPAASPASTRRRLPATDNDLVKASKRDASTAVPLGRFRGEGSWRHDSRARQDRQSPEGTRQGQSITWQSAVAMDEPDRDWSDFAAQAEAQGFFASRGGPERDPHGLDGDGDGIACGSLP